MLNHTKRFYIEKVLDGSTFIGQFDLDFDIKLKKKVRLVNIVCHNTKVEKGVVARNFVENICSDRRIFCRTFKDRYGKWSNVLGIIYLQDGDNQYINLNNLLVEKGLAVSMKGNNGDRNNEVLE